MNKQQNLVARAAAALGRFMDDIAIVTGAGCVAYGAGLIYVPAGFISGGALLLAYGILLARRAG